MKLLLFFAITSLPAITLSQNTSDDFTLEQKQKKKNLSIVDSFKIRGYVAGTRLDSIDAEYGEFYWQFQSLVFDFGQPRKNRDEMYVTSETGEKINFKRNSLAMILNFFKYNGWELMTYETSNNGNTILLRKLKY